MSSDRDLFPRSEILELIRRAMPRACFGGYTSPVPSLLDAAVSSRAAIADYTAARAALIDRLSIFLAGGAGELTPARAAALDRLINDLTAARAANLDAAITSRASGADYTAARAAFLDAAISSRMTAAQQNISAAQAANLDAAVSSRLSTIITSIQQGSIVMGDGTASAALTITGVTIAKTVIFFLGNEGGTQLGSNNAGLTLTNATTVTCTRLLATGQITTRFMVVEFK